MANYNFTKYAIEGKKEVLTKIADTINESDGMTKTVLDKLCLKYDDKEWENINRSEWEEGARIEEYDGTTVLFFTQACPWEKADIIDWVLGEIGETDADIYYLSECFEDEFHETNDEDGIYFPERYRVFTEADDDDVYFNTEEDAIAHIKKNCEVPDEIEDVDEILEWCDDNEQDCAYNEIQVVSSFHKKRKKHFDTKKKCTNETNNSTKSKKSTKSKGKYSDDGKTLVKCPKQFSGEFVIPEGVTEIAEYAFDECDNLISVYIPDSVVTINSYAFWECKNLSSVNLSNNIEILKNHTFFQCDKLSVINIPDSVRKLESSALYNVGVTSIKIGKNVTSIGNTVVRGKNLISIIVDPENINYDSRENCNAIIETKTNTLICSCKSTIIPKSIEKIDEYGFSCTGVKSIVIPNSVTEIGNYAFKGCFDLESIIIPKSVTKIGEHAFGDTGLVSLVIPEGITVIEEGIVSYCRSLKSITLPSSIIELHDLGIECKKLKEIHIQSSHPENIEVKFRYSLDEVTKCTLYVPKGTEKVYKQHPILGKFKHIKAETFA